MGIALWVVQVLVAAAFLMSGATKLSQPKEKLLKNMAWVEDFSQPSLRIIGALEVLGAIGVVLAIRRFRFAPFGRGSRGCRSSRVCRLCLWLWTSSDPD